MTVAASTTSDDTATRYAAVAMAPFTTLRRIAAQLAGFRLLSLATRHGRHLQDAPLTLARAALDEATDALRALHPPSAARHYHLHLLKAARALALAIDGGQTQIVIRSSDDCGDGGETAINAAIAHLRKASYLLPGFEVADFSQACCAHHVGAMEVSG